MKIRNKVERFYWGKMLRKHCCYLLDATFMFITKVYFLQCTELILNKMNSFCIIKFINNKILKNPEFCCKFSFEMIFLIFAAGASLHQLTIVKVVTGDSGEYSCAAQNVHGSASSSTDVSVEGEKLKCWRQKDISDVWRRQCWICWRLKTSVLKVRN